MEVSAQSARCFADVRHALGSCGAPLLVFFAESLSQKVVGASATAWKMWW